MVEIDVVNAKGDMDCPTGRFPLPERWSAATCRLWADIGSRVTIVAQRTRLVPNVVAENDDQKPKDRQGVL